MKVTIYHNPRCTKSRETLALLRRHGYEPDVVEYLKHPLEADDLRRLLKQLQVAPYGLVRTKEKICQELGLNAESSDDEIIAAMVSYPVLMERPVVVVGGRAVIGRPPENVLTILPASG